MGKIKIHKSKICHDDELKDNILRSLFGKEPDDPMIFRVISGYRVYDMSDVFDILDEMLDALDYSINYKIYSESTLMNHLKHFIRPECCEYLDNGRFWKLTNLYFGPNDTKIISDGNGKNIIHYCGGDDFIYIAVAGAGWVIVVDENVEI